MPEERRIELAVKIIAAYVSNNKVELAKLPELIRAVYGSLGAPEPPSELSKSASQATAAQIRRSITHDALISFEDGRPYRLLKRHLTTLDLTPAAYRQKWGLPTDYPMVAPAYAAKRREWAKASGLGSKTRRRSKA